MYIDADEILYATIAKHEQLTNNAHTIIPFKGEMDTSGCMD